MTEYITDKLLEAGVTEEQIKQMHQIGYFDGPASLTRNSHDGGLAEHAENVLRKALEIDKALNLGIQESDITLASVFHCIHHSGKYSKQYNKDGTLSKRPYKIKDNILVMGTGAKSLYITTNILNIKLKPHVATAIYYHTAYKQGDFSNELTRLQQQPLEMILTWLLITADTYCTWIHEVQIK